MKRICILIAALFVVAFYGCEPEGHPEKFGIWKIDNQTSYSFESVLVSTNDYFTKDGFESSVSPMAQTKITPDKHVYTAWESSYANPWGSDSVPHATKITFNFPNGVSHTFEGDMIDCDVRNTANWVVTYSGAENHIATHVYTFTQEDYEEIRALYK